MAFEYSKWGDKVTPAYELLVPFIRGVVGPFDYEPGQMRNAQPEAFRVVETQPMSQGTRAHQMALYLAYESPYAKMGGNVSDYLREPELTAFMASIPTIWQETRALDARLGEYLVVARTAADGSVWIGAVGDGRARTLRVPLAKVVGAGRHRMVGYEDGPNASRYGADHRRFDRLVTAAETLTVRLAPGGGFVARLEQSPMGGAKAPR